MITKAFVLAAGEGRRLRPLTLHTPKPLMPIHGTHCLARTLHKLQAFGITDVVMNTHHLADAIHAYVAGRPGITISHEYTLLDSGGGIRHVLPFMGDAPFFVINGDIWWEDAPTSLLHKLASAWQPTMGALLTLVDHTRIPLYAGVGDYNLAATGHATHRGAQPRAPYVYGGIQLIHPAAYKPFKDGEVFSNKAVWDALEAQGALYGLEHTEFWLDMGTPEALAYLNNRPYTS